MRLEQFFGRYSRVSTHPLSYLHLPLLMLHGIEGALIRLEKKK